MFCPVANQICQFTIDRTLDDIERIEKALDDLETQRKKLAKQLAAQTLSAQQITKIKELAAEVSKDLDIFRKDFEGRCRLIEVLDLQATLAVEDGKKVMHVECYLGNDTLPMEDDHENSRQGGSSGGEEGEVILPNEIMDKNSDLHFADYTIFNRFGKG